MSVTLKKITVRQIVIIGLMAALCLVSNYFSIPIPIGIDKSRIHLGNVFCILSAFMLGPVGGGLAAGIGAFFSARENTQPGEYSMAVSFRLFCIVYHNARRLSIFFNGCAEIREKG